MRRTDKTDDKKKISFIFCMNNIGVFYKYSNLALKNIYLTNLRLYKMVLHPFQDAIAGTYRCEQNVREFIDFLK